MKMLDPKDLEQKKAVAEKKVEATGELLIEVSLPSKGKHGYPELFIVRPLKIKDVKPLIVSRVSNELDYARRVIEAISNTIVKPANFDIKDLSFEDLIKIITSQRVNSLGRTFDITWDCYECGKNNQIAHLDLINDLSETELSDEYPEEPMTLEDGIKFRMPRIDMFFNEELQSFDDLTDYDMFLSALNVNKEPFSVLKAKADEVNLTDYKDIMTFIQTWRGYGLDKNMHVKCSGCGKEVELPVPFFLFLAR